LNLPFVHNHSKVFTCLLSKEGSPPLTYPIDLYFDDDFPNVIDSQETFFQALKELFSDSKTKDLIRNLISLEEEPDSRSSDKELDKLAIDDEFPPEEDLPF